MTVPDVQQAGAIAVRVNGRGVPLFLVVTSRRNPDLWIFPKGHVEPGETAADAAQRELREEAGVIGRIVQEVGASTFQDRGRHVRVRYFAAAALSDEPALEGRQIAWLPAGEARTRVAYAGLRELLDAAAHAFADAGLI